MFFALSVAVAFLICAAEVWWVLLVSHTVHKWLEFCFCSQKVCLCLQGIYPTRVALGQMPVPVPV